MTNKKEETAVKTILLACETIREEIEHAALQTGCRYDIRWIQSGLHNYPKKLKSVLQEALDSIDSCDRVIMTFGICGNATIGLKAGDFKLILPKADDCITLLLGSNTNRAALSEGGSTYFMTNGWLTGEENLWKEYKRALTKFGNETTEMIFNTMLKNYKKLGVIDTQSYNVEAILPNTLEIARTLRLEHTILTSSLEYLCRLLTGPWDNERFFIVQPYNLVDITSFRP